MGNDPLRDQSLAGTVSQNMPCFLAGRKVSAGGPPGRACEAAPEEVLPTVSAPLPLQPCGLSQALGVGVGGGDRPWDCGEALLIAGTNPKQTKAGRAMGDPGL